MYTSLVVKVLELCIDIHMSFSTKGASLYHRDQHQLEFEVRISINDGTTWGHVSSRGSGELTNGLIGHDTIGRWLASHKGRIGYQQGSLRRDETRSNPSQDSIRIFLEVFRQVENSHALLYCVEAGI